MNSIRSLGILISSTFIVLICFHQVSAAEICNRVVAIVNDDVITLYELNQRMKELTGVEPEDFRAQDKNKYLQARRTILEALIDDKIAQEKIRELGIKVTPQEIDATLEKIKEDKHWTQEDLLKYFQEQGITYEKYRETLKKDIERYQLLNYEVKSKIIIREEEIRSYYQDHIKEFSSEGKVHLASIFLMRKDPDDETEFRKLRLKGEDILARLREGEDFGELARKFSEGPGADEGGDLGEFKLDQLNPALKKIIENIPEGGFSDLIIMQNGIQIVKLVKNQKQGVRSFEEVRDDIQTILYRQELNRQYMSWIGELRKKSYTKIIF